MGVFKFLTDNLADPDQYGSLTYSSQQTNFPATNVTNKIRRSKVWRSNGCFEVTSSNNTIIFRESAGVDLTATIAASTYTTAASFMTAVKAALDDAGVATYTVTQTSNYRFTIASNLGGGATVFELRFADALNTSEGLLGFDAANLSGASTYTSDYLTINTSEWLTFDLGVPTSVTDFALIGARNAGIQISPGATIKLQGNVTDSWSAPVYDQTLTYDDNAICVLSSSALYSTSPLRFWRVQIQDQNPAGYIEIGALFLGIGYTPTRGAAQFPLSGNFEDRTTTQFSEGGQTFSDILPQTERFEVQFSALTISEIEEIKSIFARYGTGSPFWVAMDTAAVWNTAANSGVKLVTFANEPKWELTSPGFFRSSLSLREQL